MSLARYGEYKRSGESWLRELPSHWDLTPLKHLVDLRSGGTPSKENTSFWDGDVPWASAKDLKVDQLAATGDSITQHAIDSGAASLVPTGAVLVVVRGMILAKTFPVSETLRPMAINQDLKAVVVRERLVGPFLAWLLRGTAKESLLRLDEAGHGTKALRMEAWTSIKLPVPPAIEQATIATFLNRETAKIDALIAEQEKLIALLAEKRQATISHAVTKGLDPKAPMQDSGVEWLGEVPAHWKVLRVKALSHFTTSGPRGWSERITDDGSLFIQSGDLNDVLGLDYETAKRVNVSDDAEAARTRLADGDVVVCITGAKTGNVALCSSLHEPAYVNQHLCLIRPNDEVHGQFLALSLKSTVGQTQFEVSQYGLKQGLSLENVRELWAACPPREEQEAIFALLDAETTRLDTLRAESERVITLLKERRSALISAAVTGQIDVRNA